MSFSGELHRIDVERFSAVFDALFNNLAAGSEDFMQTEIDQADAVPVLDLLGQLARQKTDRLAEGGLDRDYLQGIRTGVDMARIALAAYAAGEAPDDTAPPPPATK